MQPCKRGIAMDIETYIDTVLASQRDDWQSVHSPIFLEGHEHLVVLKTNLEISIATGLKHLDDFNEEWIAAGAWPDNHAFSEYVDMLWNGRPVRREVRVLHKTQSSAGRLD